MQTRSQSFFESVINVLIGYTVALMVQLVVFPLYGISTSLVENMEIAIIFTIVSIFRSYAVRRVFNRFHR